MAKIWFGLLMRARRSVFTRAFQMRGSSVRWRLGRGLFGERAQLGKGRRLVDDGKALNGSRLGKVRIFPSAAKRTGRGLILRRGLLADGGAEHEREKTERCQNT